MIMQALAVVQVWLLAHQMLVTFLVWPAGSALLTFIFRKHSEDEYAQLPAWLGSFLRLVTAIGCDSPTALAWFAKFLGRAPGMKPLVIICMALLAPSVACLTAKQIKGALDAIQFACVFANADLQVPEIQQACGIADDLIPAVKKAIDDLKIEQKKAAARKVSVARDAGPDAK